MKQPWLGLTLILFGLTACNGQVQRLAELTPTVIWVTPTIMPALLPPTPTTIPPTVTLAPAIMAQAVVTPWPAPTATRPPTPTPIPPSPTPVDWLAHVGRTADNLIYLGNPNAPVTMIDYSDFL